MREVTVVIFVIARHIHHLAGKVRRCPGHTPPLGVDVAGENGEIGITNEGGEIGAFEMKVGKDVEAHEISCKLENRHGMNKNGAGLPAPLFNLEPIRK